MQKVTVIIILAIMICVPRLAADETSLDMQGHQTFSQELVEKCLDRRHGEMMRCIREGITAVAGEDIAVMDREDVGEVSLWEAPPEARAEPNPYPRDEQSVIKGKIFFRAQCVQCHGGGGAGDGPAAKDFGRPIADLTRPETQNRTDGELMWKITEGGWPMPAFGYQEEWTRDDLWHVINYLRTLSFDEAR